MVSSLRNVKECLERFVEEINDCGPSNRRACYIAAALNFIACLTQGEPPPGPRYDKDEVGPALEKLRQAVKKQIVEIEKEEKSAKKTQRKK